MLQTLHIWSTNTCYQFINLFLQKISTHAWGLKLLKELDITSFLYFFFSFTLKFSENVTEQGYKNLSTWVKDLVYYIKKKTTSFFFLDVTIIITVLEIWLFFLNITVT